TDGKGAFLPESDGTSTLSLRNLADDKDYGPSEPIGVAGRDVRLPHKLPCSAIRATGKEKGRTAFVRISSGGLTFWGENSDVRDGQKRVWVRGVGGRSSFPSFPTVWVTLSLLHLWLSRAPSLQLALGGRRAHFLPSYGETK
ncbi:unnamed protein product, partial [Ixodes pacificus]